MRTQLKTLFLLVDVFIVLLIYALCPATWSMAGPPLRKLKLTSGEAGADPVTTLVDTLAALPEVEQEKKVVKDTLPQRILFFGDSMLEGLSRRLCDYGEKNGHEVHTVLWYSSSSQKWAQTQTLDYYIKEKKPTFIICCLCSNELFVRDLDERDGYIRTIVKKMGDIPFIWISPPNWKEDTGINELIIKNVGIKRYFDSRHLKLARAKDGAHPTFAAAADWFDLVAEWMSSDQTAHPSKMDKPDKKVKWHNVTMLQPDNPGK